MKKFSIALRNYHWVLLAWILSAAASPAVRAADNALTLHLSDAVSLRLVRVAPGSFTQGSPVNEPGRGADETQRKVLLTKTFLLGETPVTRTQFELFVRETGYKTEAERGPSGGYGWDGKQLSQKRDFTWRAPGFPQDGNHPVTLVTWGDAQAFCAWVGRKSGRVCTLPSEAQWEYACRAGATTSYHGAKVDEIAWHRDNANSATHAVKAKQANAWGLFDMAGNVNEWCLDWYGPYSIGEATDPVANVAPSGETPRRVLRGGSWLRDPKHTRSAARFRNSPASRNADNGFRVLIVED